jgi:hypothetical protein
VRHRAITARGVGNRYDDRTVQISIRGNMLRAQGQPHGDSAFLDTHHLNTDKPREARLAATFQFSDINFGSKPCHGDLCRAYIPSAGTIEAA